MDLTKASDFNSTIDYSFHSNIVEYDMKAASLSVAERFNLLDKDTIELMKLLPKQQRSIKMGCLQRDNKEFNNILRQTIINVRNQFVEENEIAESDIMSTHFDAIIFRSNKNIKEDINGIHFKKEQESIGYIKYQNQIEMFYDGNCISFKQIPKDLVAVHTIGLNKFLLDFFRDIDKYNENTLKKLSRFQKKYLQDQLPNYFYPAFGKIGSYKYENLKLLSFIAKLAMNEMRSW